MTHFKNNTISQAHQPSKPEKTAYAPYAYGLSGFAQIIIRSRDKPLVSVLWAIWPRAVLCLTALIVFTACGEKDAGDTSASTLPVGDTDSDGYEVESKGCPDGVLRCGVYVSLSGKEEVRIKAKLKASEGWALHVSNRPTTDGYGHGKSEFHLVNGQAHLYSDMNDGDSAESSELLKGVQVADADDDSVEIVVRRGAFEFSSQEGNHSFEDPRLFDATQTFSVYVGINRVLGERRSDERIGSGVTDVQISSR